VAGYQVYAVSPVQVGRTRPCARLVGYGNPGFTSVAFSNAGRYLVAGTVSGRAGVRR
jgi:hypothetical protein